MSGIDILTLLSLGNQTNVFPKCQIIYWSSLRLDLQEHCVTTRMTLGLKRSHTFNRTHHTSFPRQTGWSSCVHREGRWPEPPGSSVQYQGSTPPRHRCPWACLPSRSSFPCPRQGFRCRSSCWDQSWRSGSPSRSLEQTRERPGIPGKKTTTKQSLSATEQWTSASPPQKKRTQCTLLESTIWSTDSQTNSDLAKNVVDLIYNGCYGIRQLDIFSQICGTSL